MRFFTQIIFLFSLSMIGFAQSGDLDPSFADGGILQADISVGGFDTPHDIVVQPDEKILVALSTYSLDTTKWELGVTRLNADGTIDSTFAGDGTYRYENLPFTDLCYHVELLEDGSVLIAGGYGDSAPDVDLIVVKLNSNGTPDTGFGNTGDGAMIWKVDTGQDYARSLAITDNGKILIGGYSYVPGFNFRRNLVARLNADGSVDTSFGVEGIFIWNDDNTTNEIHTIHLDADGNIFASGYSKPSSADRPSLFKILPDGSGLDTSFGDDGTFLSPVEGKGYGMEIHQNGNIMICSGAFTGMGNDIAVTAVKPDGTIDASFGFDGVFLADNDASDVGLDLVIQTDGKIVVCGETGGGFFGNPRRFFTTRCLEDGTLDTSWGGTGMIITNTFDPFFAFANAVTIQPHDGKVLITGAGAFTGNDMLVVRYGNEIDADMDGFFLGQGDCDDANVDVNPDVIETPYNGIDDDCNEMTPDDDLDGDGFVLADDCDDENMEINPDAIEIPNNGIDEDCDGMDLIDAVKESALSQKFDVYPNPTNNLVYLDFDSNTLQVEVIKIADYTGKILKTIPNNLNNNKLGIQLDGLNTGVLILSIHTNEGIAVKRLIKQ